MWVFRLQKMYVILTRVEMVEPVFQLTHPMTVTARSGGLDLTVKVRGKFQ